MMANVTYNTRLIFSNNEDKQKIFEMLESQRLAVNEASKIHFGAPRNSIVDLHASFYKKFRECQPEIPAQIVISAEQECLSKYRSIKSNKHKISAPPIKKALCMRLDKRSYSYKNKTVSLISLNKRVKCQLFSFPKLENLLSRYRFCDPLVFVKGNEIWIGVTFEIPTELPLEDSACGIDLGKRMAAVTSEGKFYQDKKFNGEIRKLRYNKRKLQSKGTKSARRHLKKLRRKERNKNKNQSHLLANAILRETKASVLVLEELRGIKKKKSKGQNKNSISQVPFYQLKQFLKYKAPIFHRKTVITIDPKYTSQIDHRTGKREGERKGRRFYGVDGVVLDADQNASINIALKSKLPVSYIRILDGQAVVNQPIVCKS